MSKTSKIIVPQENVSDDSYTVIEHIFKNGDKVSKNQNVVVCEGSKTAFELAAESDGYITYKKNVGDEVLVGEIIAEISLTANQNQEKNETANSGNFEFSISKKAEKLATLNNVDLSIFVGKSIVTSTDIQNVINSGKKQMTRKKFKDDDFAIIGAGGHAKQIYDCFEDKKNIAGLIVNDLNEETFNDLDILGNTEDLEELRERNLQNIIIGFGSLKHPKKRSDLASKLSALGFNLKTVIHPSSIIDESAEIKPGCQIFAGAIIGSRAVIDANAIINSGAIVSHDCHIMENAHITPGAILAGDVEVGKNTIIGMGCTIFIGVKVASDKIIDNGTDVFQNT